LVPTSSRSFMLTTPLRHFRAGLPAQVGVAVYTNAR
jgi:hypothetical protein